MNIKNPMRFILLSLALMVLGSQLLPAQQADDDRPHQLDILKINVFQFFVNEARVMYEMQIRPKTSLEFGLGYIYKNGFWYKQGGRPMLATGGAVYVGLRNYFVRKTIFYQPKILSYIEPMLFYRYSTYKDEWLLFPGGLPQFSECERFSGKIHQLGLVFRVGWQTRVGRAALDMYGGLGFKWQPTVRTSTAFNDSTDVCEVLPTTDFSTYEIRLSPVNVVLNAGVKVGLRRKNRERNYQIKEEKDPVKEGTPDSPPRF
jgi:hypothetical protein